MEFLDNALDGIELVSADDNLLALVEGTQRLELGLNTWTLAEYTCK
jgi:hypothetical protein